MKKSRIGKTALIAAAVTLTASLSVGSALAYFTTYCTAEGSYTMTMGFPETDIEEEVDSAGKHVTIQNTGDYDCFVRVKVFVSSPVDMNASYSGQGWESRSDGYWYYTPVLTAHTDSQEFLVSFEYPGGEDAPDSFDIIVVYESVPVLYNENGEADMELSWNNTASIITGETTTEPDTETGTEIEADAGGDTETTTGQEGE